MENLILAHYTGNSINDKLSAAGILDSKMENNLSELRRYVREKLRSGIYKLTTDRRGRSKVWEHFRMVLDDQGNLVGYAGCMYCLDVLRHDPHMSGTSSLFSHLRSCSAAGVLPAHSMVIPEVLVKEEVFEDSRNNEEWDIFTRTADICAEYVAIDMHPYQCLNGHGFRKLAQFLVDCGALHGKFEVESVLPPAATVAKRVCARAGEERRKLREALRARLLHGAAAVVIHTLTAHISSPLVALTVHYIKDWSIETDFLGVCDLRNDIQRRAKEEVLRFLGKFGFEASPEKLTLIMSADESIHGTCKEATMITSFSCMINQSVNQLLKNVNQSTKDIFTNLEKFREIIRLVNKDNPKLSAHLEVDIINGESDWRNTMQLAAKVCDVRSELLTATQEQRLLDALSSESVEQMQHLVTLLKPFEDAIEDIECCQTPTLQKVVPWFLHLRNTCATDSADSGVLAALKESIKHCLDQNEDVSLLHKIAVFFNPRMNSLKILCPEDRELVRKEVKRFAQSHIAISEPPKKRSKQENSPLAYLEDNDNEHDDDSAAEREILLYTIMKDYTDSENLLLWWQRNSSMLPLLAAVAQRVLAVPASATPTTHLTKVAAKMKDLGLSWGKEHNMNDLVFLHSRLSRSSANNSDG